MKTLIVPLVVCLSTVVFAQEFPVITSPHSVSQSWAAPIDREKPGTVIVTAPVWNSLKKMAQQDRENSQIDLILEKNATLEAEEMAATIEGFWNSGKFDKALSMFPELGKLANMNKMSIGNSWRTPVPTLEGYRWGTDVRIGNRDSVLVTALDIDRATGNLFAVMLVQGDGNTNRWDFYISTDGGISWNETYDWWANYELSTISASVVAGYCYVGFHRGLNHDQAFLYRFDVNNGIQTNFSTGFPYHTVFTTTSPASIVEVSLTSNQDYYNNRLYYSTINSDGSVKFFWGLDPDFVNWTEIPTNITNASHGLDITTDQNNSNRYCWASYFTNSNSLHIDGVLYSDSWDQVMTYWTGSGTDYSSIGAYGDTITCFFDYHGTNLQCRYLVTYDDATTWNYGFADDTTITMESPAITARGGGGVGVVYRYYTNPREGRYRWRNYVGDWATPISYANNEPYYNQPSIEYLGSNKYGVVYLSWTSPVIRGAFFDRSDFTSAVGNDPNVTPQDFRLLQNYPNPFNPATIIKFNIPEVSNVSLKIYDVLGNEVSNIVDGQLEAGQYEYNFNAQNLSSGVYFYRLEAGNFVQTRKMILMK